MRITSIQDHIYWADKAANLSKVHKQIADLKGQTDLVVLPEMFTTGFCTDQPDLSESMNGETMSRLADWAKQFQLAITGSFIADDQGFLYNRAFFVFPSGEMKWADKRHLFGMSDEKTFFKSGSSPLLVEYSGLKIQVLVCYDVRFPVWARNVNNRYDLLIYVANFPDRRIADWDILLKARAIENQTYVCGLNRIGVDGLGIHYNGHSALLDFKGTDLLIFPENKTSIQTYTLEKTDLDLYRKKFPVWKDADEFEII